MNDYEDIIALPRPKLGKHRPMPRSERAAQFAPFSAVTTHREAIAAIRDTAEENGTIWELLD